MKITSWKWFPWSAALLAGCESAPAERRPVPPIDLAVPAVTETATFALG